MGFVEIIIKIRTKKDYKNQYVFIYFHKIKKRNDKILPALLSGPEK